MDPFLIGIIVSSLLLLTSIWALVDAFRSPTFPKAKYVNPQAVEHEACLRYARKEIRDIERSAGL